MQCNVKTQNTVKDSRHIVWCVMNNFVVKLSAMWGSAVKVLVAIHYSVLVARNGYIRNVVVYRVACRKWQSHSFAVAV